LTAGVTVRLAEQSLASVSSHNQKLKLAFNTVGTNDCQTRIREPAGAAWA